MNIMDAWMCEGTWDGIERMRRGRRWHIEMERWWGERFERTWGQAEMEKSIVKDTGRRGRVNLIAEEGTAIMFMEFKCSDWDRMRSDKHARRNIRRYCHQLWSYLDSADIHPDLTLHGKGVIAFLVFPKRPTDPGRSRIVLESCDELGVQIVWMNKDPDYQGNPSSPA